LQPLVIVKGYGRRSTRLASGVETMSEQESEMARRFELTERLDPLVDRYEGRTSEFLAGSAGGIGCGSIILCLWASSWIGSGLAAALGAPAVATGIILTLLIFRGRPQWRKERTRKALKAELKCLREELDALKSVTGTPDVVKSDLWAIYREEIRSYRREKRTQVESD
jgi:hypothetical protein